MHITRTRRASLAVAFVIASCLIISQTAIAGVVKSNHLASGIIPVSEQPAEEVYQLTPVPPTHKKVIDISADAKQVIFRTHPAVARNAGDTLMRGFEYYVDDPATSEVYWQSSLDGGVTWESAVSFGVIGAAYPSIGYWGADTAFFGSFVPPASYYNGARVFTVEFRNAASFLTWTAWYTDFSLGGWHDIAMCDIAVDSSQRTWNWGMTSLIMSRTITGSDNDNVPQIYSQLSQAGQVQLSTFLGYPGCRSTAAAIDPISARSYAVYDWYDSALTQWKLLIRQDFVNDWDLPTDAAVLSLTSPKAHITYPDIASYDSTLLVVTAAYEDADTTDIDIICWRSAKGFVDSLDFVSVIAGSLDAETYPRIQHVDGDRYICTFIRQQTIFASFTCDGGLTWGAPINLIDSAESVIDEYRTSDIAEGGRDIVWEYMAGFGINIDQIDWIWEDNDGDGIVSGCDNCPFTPNPDQEDSDGDRFGDVCDNCPDDPNPYQLDNDSDGWGDSCDICPRIANPDQADDDGDGIGNVCDNCPADANPDQLDSDNDKIGDVCDICPDDYDPYQLDNDSDGIGDVCDPDDDNDGIDDTLDNCQYVYNPDQADSDQNGVGDVCECCGLYTGGRTGNVDCSTDGDRNLADITRLIDFVYISHNPLCCKQEANTDGDSEGIATLSDITRLIDFVYISQTETALCQ